MRKHRQSTENTEKQTLNNNKQHTVTKTAKNDRLRSQNRPQNLVLQLICKYLLNLSMTSHSKPENHFAVVKMQVVSDDFEELQNRYGMQNKHR